jgi:transcription elongation factor GreB
MESALWLAAERRTTLASCGTCVQSRHITRLKSRLRLCSNSESFNMSKAFTRESDDLPDRSMLARRTSLLPPGAKNYLTSDGAQRLREEWERLIRKERPEVAAVHDDDTKRRLQVLDQRIQYLEQSLRSAVVVPSPAAPWEQVRFGATVTVRERDSGESRYRIVGADETDLDCNWVSWLSPIAKALLNAKVGQRVRFKFPSGEKELEIVAITYE